MLSEPARALVTGIQLLVVSDRMLPVAGELGFEKPPLVADNATDDAVLRALLAWARSADKECD
jgi:hypothetical protein